MDIESGEDSGSFVTTILVLAVVGAGLFLIRRYFKGAQFTERASAKGKVAVVTGCLSGIGLETVRGLNLAKAKVYMLCRGGEQRAVDAKLQLVKLGCDVSRLITVECDLTKFASIRKAAEEVLAKEKVIDILVNNAGIMFYPKFEKTEDGHEMTWQSNYLGHFLLTEMLLPAISESSSARIINVSSKLHLNSKGIDVSSVNDKSAFGMFEPYNRSKLAQVMHARELSRRLHSEGSHHVTINALHPGVITSNLGRHLFLSREPFKTIYSVLGWLFMKTTRDGAQTTLYLALSKKVEGISGKYFSDCALASAHKLVTDDYACSTLYNWSLEQIVK